MSYVKPLFLTGLFLILSSASHSAVEMPNVSSPTVKTLSLNEFLSRATTKDTEFQEILIDHLYLKYQKTLQLPPKDVIVSILSQYNFYQDIDDDGADTSISLSKLFPFSGSSISTEYGINSSNTGGISSSDFSITLSQSIAENAFGRDTRLFSRIIGLENEIARYQIIEAYEDYLASLISAYYEWYESYESLLIGQSAYQSNLKLFENMKARQKNHIALPIDVNKVELQLLSKKETLINLNEQYKSRLNIVERAIREEIGDTAIPASPPIPLVSDDFIEKMIEGFSESSRTIQVLNLLSKKSQLNLNREAQDLLPSLNIFAGFEVEGDHSGLKNRRNDNYYTGASLDWPLPETVDKAEKRVAELDRRKIKLSNQNISYRIHTRIKNLSLQLQRETELIKSAEERIKLANQVLEAESENYTFGRASLNDYIIAVNALDGSRLEKIAREINLLQIILELRIITDTLVTDNQVELPH